MQFDPWTREVPTVVFSDASCKARGKEYRVRGLPQGIEGVGNRACAMEQQGNTQLACAHRIRFPTVAKC